MLVDQFVDRTVQARDLVLRQGLRRRMCRWRIRSVRCCRARIAEAAKAEGIPFSQGGTYVCIEGPQFSTYAESLTYKGLGYDVVGMTAMPEAKLAREAEITYATIAMVTDFDCWHPEHDDVDVASVVKIAQTECRDGGKTDRPHRAGFPGRARAMPGRLRPRARRRHHDGAVRARSGPVEKTGRGSRAGSRALRMRAGLRRPTDATCNREPNMDSASAPISKPRSVRSRIIPSPASSFATSPRCSGDPRAFRRSVDELVHPFAGGRVDKVAGIEARGFIIGGAVAHQLSAGFVPIRKKGKLPHETVRIAYSLEYGVDEMEIHSDAFGQDASVILVDDLIATGGTAIAATQLLRQMGARIVAACFIIDLPDLGGAQKLRDLGVEVRSLVSFEGH